MSYRVAKYELYLEVNDAATWVLQRLRRIVEAQGTTPSKELIEIYQSVPIYYSGLSVERSGGRLKRQTMVWRAPETYVAYAVPGWLEWLAEDCLHPLPEWMTTEIMGRTSLQGSAPSLYTENNAEVFTRFEAAKSAIVDKYTPLLRRTVPYNYMIAGQDVRALLQKFCEDHWRASDASKPKKNGEDSATSDPPGTPGASCEFGAETAGGQRRAQERLPMPEDYFPPYLLLFVIYGPLSAHPDPFVSYEMSNGPTVDSSRRNKRAYSGDQSPAEIPKETCNTALTLAARTTMLCLADEALGRKRSRETKPPAAAEAADHPEREDLQRRILALVEKHVAEQKVMSERLQDLANTARRMVSLDRRSGRMDELQGCMRFLEELGHQEEAKGVAQEMADMYRRGCGDV